MLCKLTFDEKVINAYWAIYFCMWLVLHVQSCLPIPHSFLKCFHTCSYDGKKEE